MGKDIPKKVIDVTGVELTPGEPDVCLGNGEQGFECCCDECDYYLLCFPEYDVKTEAENKDGEPDALDRLLAEAFKRYAFEKNPHDAPSRRQKDSCRSHLNIRADRATNDKAWYRKP